MYLDQKSSSISKQNIHGLVSEYYFYIFFYPVMKLAFTIGRQYNHSNFKHVLWFPSQNLSHPWLLVEDAHVNMIGVLEYLNKFMQPGDYICVEDTNPLTPMMGGQGLVKELGYGLYGPTKMNTLRNFLMDHPGKYLVDTRYTDMFG